MNMRDEFEAWAKQHNHDLKRDGVVVDYACRYTDLAWNAWQASRAAVVVRIDLEDWPGSMAREIQEAIEAAGLKVAP